MKFDCLDWLVINKYEKIVQTIPEKPEPRDPTKPRPPKSIQAINLETFERMEFRSRTAAAEYFKTTTSSIKSNYSCRGWFFYHEGEANQPNWERIEYLAEHNAAWRRG